MVCGGGREVRRRIELIDTSCVMQEILKGGLEKPRPLARPLARDETPSSGPSPSMGEVKATPRSPLPGALEPEMARDLLHVIAMKASKWMYTTDEKENGAPLEPPQAAAFVLRNGQVLRVAWEPLHLSDAYLQEQFAMFMVTVEGRCLLPPLRVLVLAFRGTARAQDVLGNVSPLVNEDAFAQYGMNVHSAWHGLVATRRHLDLLWSALHDAARHGATELLITGHSMGGALGQISVLQILAKLDNETAAAAKGRELREPRLSPQARRLAQSVTCVSFGAPMPFAPEAQERLSVPVLHAQRRALDWLASRTLTYVNNNDIVARLPGCIEFLRNILKTVKPASLVYKLGLSLLEGSPIIRRYRPVSTISMLGHLEVQNGHMNLNLLPTDPMCARAMMTRSSSDLIHSDCGSFRQSLSLWTLMGKTSCKLMGWLTGGSIYSIKDHLMERYEGYLFLALSAKELAPGALSQTNGFFNREFSKELAPFSAESSNSSVISKADARFLRAQSAASHGEEPLHAVQRRQRRAQSL